MSVKREEFNYDSGQQAAEQDKVRLSTLLPT